MNNQGDNKLIDIGQDNFGGPDNNNDMDIDNIINDIPNIKDYNNIHKHNDKGTNIGNNQNYYLIILNNNNNNNLKNNKDNINRQNNSNNG